VLSKQAVDFGAVRSETLLPSLEFRGAARLVASLDARPVVVFGELLGSERREIGQTFTR
jgi:hypothetical protein